MGTIHFGKKQVALISYALAVSTGLMGCGSYGTAPSGAATAVVTADKSSVTLGESIVLDASSSTFDTLQWFSNGTAETGCVDQSACVLTPEQVGSYEIAIQSKVSGNAQAAQASLIIQVVAAPASASLNPGRNQNSTMSLGGSSAPAPVSLSDSNGTLTISNGSLALTNLNSDSLTVNWNKSVDTAAAAATLEYLVYYSTSNNLSSVAAIEANGTAVGVYTADIATKAITGLTPETTYYFNLIAKNPSGDKVRYMVSSWKTGKAIPFDTGNISYLVTGALSSGTVTGSITNANRQVTLYPSGYTNSGAVALYKTDVEAPYAVEYEYLTGSTANADGVSFIFAKDRVNYGTVSTSGLGFSTDGKGYAVRAVTYGNPRIDIVDGTGTVLASYSHASVATNSLWKRIRVEVTLSAVKVFFDGQLVINHALALNTAYSSIGFGAGSGTIQGTHQIRNAVLYSTIPTALASIPIVNPSTISLTGITTSAATLNWTAAADGGSTDEVLSYQVYSSNSNNLTLVSDVETNGTPLGEFVSALVSKDIVASISTGKYYNVIAKNSNGFKLAYAPLFVEVGPKNLANYNVYASYNMAISPTYTPAMVTATLAADKHSITLIPAGRDGAGVAMLYNQTVQVPFDVTFTYAAGGDGASFMFGSDFADYLTTPPGGGGDVGMISNATTTKRYTVKFNVYNTNYVQILNAAKTLLAQGSCSCTGSHTGRVAVSATNITAYSDGVQKAQYNHAYSTGQNVTIGFGAGTGAATGLNSLSNVVFTQQ